MHAVTALEVSSGYEQTLLAGPPPLTKIKGPLGMEGQCEGLGQETLVCHRTHALTTICTHIPQRTPYQLCPKPAHRSRKLAGKVWDRKQKVSYTEDLHFDPRLLLTPLTHFNEYNSPPSLPALPHEGTPALIFIKTWIFWSEFH
jgi:hypothetical protein